MDEDKHKKNRRGKPFEAVLNKLHERLPHELVTDKVLKILEKGVKGHYVRKNSPGYLTSLRQTEKRRLPEPDFSDLNLEHLRTFSGIM